MRSSAAQAAWWRDLQGPHCWEENSQFYDPSGKNGTGSGSCQAHPNCWNHQKRPVNMERVRILGGTGFHSDFVKADAESSSSLCGLVWEWATLLRSGIQQIVPKETGSADNETSGCKQSALICVDPDKSEVTTRSSCCCFAACFITSFKPWTLSVFLPLLILTSGIRSTIERSR